MASVGERDYLVAGIEAGVRADGRLREQYRSIHLATGFLAQASGSARVLLGSTDVVVGVKVEIGAPDADRPDCGRIVYTVQTSSVADPKYQGRGSDEQDADLAATLQRCVDEGACGRGVGVDLSALSIVSGKKCWWLYVDGVVLNDSGNLLDALSIAVKAALSDTAIPRVEVSSGGDGGGGGDPEFEVHDDEGSRLDLSRFPVIITVSRVGRRCVVDLSSQEEGCAAASLQVAVNSQGRVAGVNKVGPDGIDPSVMLEMLQVAQRVGPGLLRSVDEQLARDAEAEEDDEDEEEGGMQEG